MNYDELQSFKTDVQKLLRHKKQTEALTLIAKHTSTPETHQYLAKFFEQLTLETDQDLILAKNIIKSSSQNKLVDVLYNKNQNSPIIIHWMCELDTEFKRCDLASKAAFPVVNYIKNLYRPYFLSLLIKKALGMCEQVLEVHKDEACDLLYQSVVRCNETALKLIRSKYKEELAEVDEYLEEIQKVWFPKSEQVVDANDLD
ncbi:Conserved_hypothetical protein [Hexamita inflata]|uniref:Uncharacterized protein n=1 Tax=Hexamita inflata TaxID=28002 RepID=A0AA86S1P7_9EUKA|nr:Conserved hypothetical protein [Hexamita inflata]CAI9976460.1 Conserved hypothetical protein [Hexamita inflata]